MNSVFCVLCSEHVFRMKVKLGHIRAAVVWPVLIIWRSKVTMILSEG